jgi:hypothetical protein
MIKLFGFFLTGIFVFGAYFISPIRVVENKTTSAEVYSFIEEDKTNENIYIAYEYDCGDFSMDLYSNAKEQGLTVWIVNLLFATGGSGHAFVVFDTIDEGLIFVEPQSDAIYAFPEVNGYLCYKDGSGCDPRQIIIVRFADCSDRDNCVYYIYPQP